MEIDASGGIVMPGMIDTHRHMWQTAMRGYGADWTLTSTSSSTTSSAARSSARRTSTPGNLLSAIEAIDAGVTTTVDWSHGLQTVEHADAAVDALRSRPRPLRARLRQHPAGPVGVVGVAGLPRFVERRFGSGDDMLGFQMAFDVTGDPEFPEKAAFEVARELGVPVTTHAGVWGATNDDGIRLMHEHGFMTPEHDLRPRRDAHRGLLPPDRRDRRLGLGLDRERAERRPGLPADVAAAQARHPGVAVDGHERVVERRPVLGDAHDARRRPLARAPRGAREAGDGHEPPPARRAGRRLGHPRRRARRSAWTQLGSLEAGKKADVVLIKNDAFAGDVPDPAPVRPRRLPGAARRRAHRARQRPRRQARRPAGRHRPRARARRAIEETVEYARATIGEEPGRRACTRRSPRRRSSTTRTSTRDEQTDPKRVVADALAAIHEVLERHRVTEEEWHAALAFLTDVGRADEFVLLSDVTRTSVLIDAMSHDGRRRATASDVEGPLYVEDPPWREAPVKIYEDYEGMGDGDVLFVRGSVTSADGTPLPDAVIDIWQTGPDGGYDIWDERQPEFNFRGRWKVEAGRRLRVPDDAAEALHGADRRAGGALPGGGRPASVAAGAHPLQGRRAGPRAAGHAGVLPRRPLPGERHHRRGQAGARAAGRARGRPPGLPFDIVLRPAAEPLRELRAGRPPLRGLVEGDSVRPLSTSTSSAPPHPPSTWPIRAHRRDGPARRRRAAAGRARGRARSSASA